MRISKVVTKTGDRGETGLAGGRRLSKASKRVAAYGEVDELNSVVGLARSFGADPRLDEMLEAVQHGLFVVGADLATPADVDGTRVDADDVAQLETFLDELLIDLDPLKEFVLPGGAPAGASLQLARTVARRAERAAVALAEEEPIGPDVVIYLNRLSDLLFVMARAANVRAGARETLARFSKKTRETP